MVDENGIGVLAATLLIGLVGLAVIRTMGGTDPNDTILVWLGNHPDLFAGIIIILVMAGIVLNLSQ